MAINTVFHFKMETNQTLEVSFLMRHLSLFVFTGFDASEGNHSETLLAHTEIYLCTYILSVISQIIKLNMSTSFLKLELNVLTQ